MKKFLFAIVAVIALLPTVASCQDGGQKVTVKGLAEGDTVVRYNSQEKNAVVDSAIVTNGVAVFDSLGEKDMFYVVGHGDKTLAYINDGQGVTINLAEETLTGSAQNNKFNDAQKEVAEATKPFYTLNEEYMAIMSDTTLDGPAKEQKVNEFMQRANNIQEQAINSLKTVINENVSTLIPAYYISDIIYDYEFNDLQEIWKDEYAYTKHPKAAGAKKVYETMVKKQEAIGKMFTDLEMADPDGKMHKLSEWAGKGNYVLVDFWASWCGPCRAEMPNVVAAYTKYHDKGFDVVGVSFDNDADKWQHAITELNMPWHHISDLKGWQCAAAEVYGINSIPASLLLDPEGKIIDRDLRGDALDKKLAEIFK